MLNKCIKKELHNSEIFALLIQNPDYVELRDKTNADNHFATRSLKLAFVSFYVINIMSLYESNNSAQHYR